jgi:hypothetical protein
MTTLAVEQSRSKSRERRSHSSYHPGDRHTHLGRPFSLYGSSFQIQRSSYRSGKAVPTLEIIPPDPGDRHTDLGRPFSLYGSSLQIQRSSYRSGKAVLTLGIIPEIVIQIWEGRSHSRDHPGDRHTDLGRPFSL